MPKLQYPKSGVIRILFLSLFLGSGLLSSAQTVSGKVTDPAKQPIAGVSVSVKGIPFKWCYNSW